MKHILFLSLICIFLTSCGSSKKIMVQTKVIHDTVYVTDINPKYHVITEAKLPNYVISKEYFPSQAYDDRIKFLVLHYTVSDYPTSIKILTKKNVSAHYLIPDTPNDTIQLLVSEDKRSYHAGYSAWNGRENLNDTSIGIEIVNKGYVKVGDSLIFQPYYDFQIKKIAALAQNIISRYDIDPTYVVGHSDIAPLRKQDPGPLFPWKTLYTQYNIGAWYNDADKELFLEKFIYDTYPYNSALEFQKGLQKYGYKIDNTGEWDKNTKDIVRAFQWHFRPEKADGIVDAETWAILQALNKKYRSK
ncbi:N-acetylmuramoyl-L-alanine amidase [Apibacter adventoris]|uniref:N-acetylmuramoyl-L-alanine amidase n=2 Tax=Apibacter adventoris TaxID=1679466 RepID=A0A2S8ACJ6_9FLAO|nr:N-acetylmuramoyl-L-alanine amidase [Apibacter adventoris]PQL92041.1 N-acetylmuramoyl-L-alanine amidase [Apibacter adventoris]PQL92684.1 N-acetylmuramoyl-L-alanine amidase [Apibacter adventoris]